MCFMHLIPITTRTSDIMRWRRKDYVNFKVNGSLLYVAKVESGNLDQKRSKLQLRGIASGKFTVEVFHRPCVSQLACIAWG
jgi:hypothetical protein